MVLPIQYLSEIMFAGGFLYFRLFIDFLIMVFIARHKPFILLGILL